MKIVGVGCGPGMLTAEAARTLRGAALIYGSVRAIALARDHIPPECEVHEIADYRSLRSLPGHAVVLSTGDPMLAGLGYLPGDVIPGISSLQVAFARLKIPLTRAAVVTAHGKTTPGPWPMPGRRSCGAGWSSSSPIRPSMFRCLRPLFRRRPGSLSARISATRQNGSPSGRGQNRRRHGGGFLWWLRGSSYRHRLCSSDTSRGRISAGLVDKYIQSGNCLLVETNHLLSSRS